MQDYCWQSGKGRIRKKRFEEEDYVSPDYVFPEGSTSEVAENAVYKEDY